MVDKEQFEKEFSEKLYTLRELSDEFKERGQKVTITMLKNYIKKGQVNTTKVAGQNYVKESDIDWGMDISPRKGFYEKTTLQDRNENQGTRQAVELETRSSGLRKS